MPTSICSQEKSVYLTHRLYCILYTRRVFRTGANAETLRYAHGQCTPGAINRARKIAGAVGSAVHAAFHNNVCETNVDDSYRSKYDYCTFCSEYVSDRSFDNVPGRSHSGFSTLTPENSLTVPRRVEERLQQTARPAAYHVWSI